MGALGASKIQRCEVQQPPEKGALGASKKQCSETHPSTLQSPVHRTVKGALGASKKQLSEAQPPLDLRKKKGGRGALRSYRDSDLSNRPSQPRKENKSTELYMKEESAIA